MSSDEPPRERAGRGAGLVAVFLSAFLAFQIQPLIGKYVLPWYGGSAAVWTTCLVFFQVLLFCGYLYAHFVSRLPARAQAAIHVPLLVVACLIPIAPHASWKPVGDESPLPRIVAMLSTTVGLPYLALAATGPLLQAWHWRILPRVSPYPLYALSNAGSLGALLSYPLLVEPRLSGPQQTAIWRAALVLLVVPCLVLAGRLWLRGGEAGPSTAFGARGGDDPPPRAAVVALWIGWAACGVLLFMAVTNQLTLNVASVPFLWVLPLSIYLLAFIVAFSGDRAYPRTPFALLLVVALAALVLLIENDVRYTTETTRVLPILARIGLYAGILFVLCMVCHGELHRLRPPPRQLTAFYLAIACGGALGGLVVGALAPLVFLLYQELQLGMLALGALYLLTRILDPAPGVPGPRRRAVAAAAGVGLLLLGAALARQTSLVLRGTVATHRSFFGVLRIQELDPDDPLKHAIALVDGAIMHGHQLLRPELRREPTTYYSRVTGLGRVLALRQQRKPALRIGVVGLGTGTIAAYGRPADELVFYEINPQVVDVARHVFSYLTDCRAGWEVALGDARLSLERESARGFDLLVLDAFSSDAIPVHLLTAEAFDVYERHLAPDGVVAANISNLHLELSTILYRHAEARRFHALEVRNLLRPERLTLAAEWMFLSRDTAFMNDVLATLRPFHESGEIRLGNRPRERHAGVRAWTDRASSLLTILK